MHSHLRGSYRAKCDDDDFNSFRGIACEGHTDRQSDRQTDRQADRQMTDRQTDRQMTDRQTSDRQTDTHTQTHTHTLTHSHARTHARWHGHNFASSILIFFKVASDFLKIADQTSIFSDFTVKKTSATNGILNESPINVVKSSDKHVARTQVGMS